jgi:hypothetical protein
MIVERSSGSFSLYSTNERKAFLREWIFSPLIIVLFGSLSVHVINGSLVIIATEYD